MQAAIERSRYELIVRETKSGEGKILSVLYFVSYEH